MVWWCNIKVPFGQAFNRSKGPGMQAMLGILRVPLIGHHHLGIDDSRNIASIPRTLVRKHCSVISATGGSRPLTPRLIQTSTCAIVDTCVPVASTADVARKSSLSEHQKHILKLDRALREIDKLKQRRGAGEVLQRNQLSKIEKEAALRLDLANVTADDRQLESSAEPFALVEGSDMQAAAQ